MPLDPAFFKSLFARPHLRGVLPVSVARTFNQMVAEAEAEVQAVSPAEAQRRLQDDPNTLLVDVRDSAEAQTAGAIPGAVHTAYGDLLYKADSEVPEAWQDPQFHDRSRPIITHCGLGPLSAIAAKSLKDKGFTNVTYVEGGIEAWKGAGLPSTSGETS